jgi:hypothetical protein
VFLFTTITQSGDVLTGGGTFINHEPDLLKIRCLRRTIPFHVQHNFLQWLKESGTENAPFKGAFIISKSEIVSSGSDHF